eukprot:3259585-Prorocentrum_lima.AAC.1
MCIRDRPCEVLVAGVEQVRNLRNKRAAETCSVDSLRWALCRMGHPMSVGWIVWEPSSSTQQVSRDDFVVTGTAVPSLFGVCEASYKEELTPEELLDTLR